MKRLQKIDNPVPLWLAIPVLLFVTLLLLTFLAGRTQFRTAPGLVTAQQAAVYSEADEAAATNYAVPHNTVFTVLEQKDGWYFTCIKREEGLYGWLKSSDVTLPTKMECNGISGPASATGVLMGSVENMAPDAAVKAEKSVLRAGPGHIYAKAAKLPMGTSVIVRSYEDGWFYVTGTDLEGYVPADALLLDVNPLMILDQTDPEDSQQDETSTDDGKKNETSTDTGKKDETSTDDGKKDETPSTDDGKKDETPSTDDSKKEDKPKEEEKKPPVALPASSGSSVLAAGSVSDDGVRLRKGAGTDSSIITEMSKGTPLAVLGWKDGWYKVKTGSSTGYVSDEYARVATSTDSLKGYAVVNTDALNMRSSPSTDGKIVTVLEEKDVLTLQGFENGWFKVKFDSKSGYVSGDYVTLQLTKPATPTTNSGGSGSGGSATVPPQGSGTGAQIASYAQTFIGVPYVYGGASPSGFDCSGFIKYVYAHFGYSLPHGTNAQYKMGTKISKSELQPGDLVFFNNGGNPTTHAGIYIGNGKFVHSTEYDYGDRVVDGVQIHPLSNAWYSGIYVGARRIVN